MIRLTNRERYKKSIAWQLASKDFIKSFSACCESVIITYHHAKSFSKLLYKERPIKIYDYDPITNKSTLVDSTETSLVSGTSYITAYDFINADLKNYIDLDDSGFLFLKKHMYSQDHLFPLTSRNFVNGRMSTVVIPPSFLSYDKEIRKCFYMKMLGYSDWGRAYYLAKSVLLDIIDLVLPYLALRCDLEISEDNSGRGYVNLNDIEDKILVKGAVLSEKDVVLLICKHLELDNISSSIVSNKCYSVKIKETYASSSRRYKKV